MIKKFNTYINSLKIRLLFSDDNPGKIYILDSVETVILFIVDIPDSCVYINQDIIDEFGYNRIKEDLGYLDIHYDIFPYFSEMGDISNIAPSDNKWFIELMESIDNFYIYSDSIMFLTEDYFIPYGFYRENNILNIDDHNKDYNITGTVFDFFKIRIIVNYE